MDHHFDDAAKAIFVAMILDTLDGRVARLTHTRARSGGIRFAVRYGLLRRAPALVMYEWALNGPGTGRVDSGAGLPALGARCALHASTPISKWSTSVLSGTAEPAAAALVAGFLWLAIDNKSPSANMACPGWPRS